MKKPISTLRATTAIVVSLSFASQAAIAAGAPVTGEFKLAQATDTLPENAQGKAKGKEKKAEEAAAEESVEATAEEPIVEEAEAAATEAAEPAAESAETAEAAPEPEAAEAQVEGEAAAAAETAVEPTATEEPVAAEAETTAETDTAVEAETAAEPAQSEEQQAQESAEPATEQAAETAAEAQTAAEEAPASDEATSEPDKTPATEEAASEPTDAPATEEAAAEPTEAPATEEAASEPVEPQTDTEQTADTEGTEGTADATAETTGVEAETTAETQGDPEETVEQVTEESVEEVTKSGGDVVVKETTSNEELAKELETLKQELRALEQAEPVTVEEEVVTEETTRTSGEEATASGSDDDDDNDVWKYLGAAAAGAAVGALVPALGGRLVQNQGDRVIVERDGEFFVRADENVLLRRPGVRVQNESFADGFSRSTVTREDGSQVVTLRDPGGFIVRRTLIQPDGTEVVLIEENPEDIYSFVNFDDTLPPLTVNIPDDRYVVDYSQADREDLRQALLATPVQEIDRTFSLREVRENERVRALVPRVDLDSIHFDTGSAAIRSGEADDLAELGQAMKSVIEENPREVFLVEGHTDAVGSNLMNLALSDRRAEAVALALTEYYDVPPENLVVQGYGERYLKEQTEGPSQANRRATVRRITPLIDRVASSR